MIQLDATSVTALTPTQRDAAMRWIADDPDPDTRVELQRVLAAALTGDQAGGRRPDRPHGRDAAVRHGRAARAGPRRPERDERRRGPPDDRRARALAARAGPGRGAGRRRPGRPPRIGGVRRGRRRGARGGRVRRPDAARAAAHPRARVRGPGDRRRRRCPDHRLAQPARRQRLQGLRRRRGPARPAGGHRDRGRDRRGAPGRLRPRRAAARDRRRPRGLPRPGRPPAARHRPDPADRAHPAARRRRRDGRARAWPAPASPTCTSSPRRPCRTPRFPTVAFPNPEEPGVTDALLATAERVGADLAVALDPDADRCALGVPTPGGLADADRRRDGRAARGPHPAARRRHAAIGWSRPRSSRRRCSARSPPGTARASPRP